MAKSKKKTSKANKSKKTDKVIKSNKPVKQTTKQAISAKASVAKAEKSSSPVAIAVVACFVVAIVIGALLIGGAEDKTIQSSAKPTTNPNSQQTIEVVESDSDVPTPESREYKIQGSSPGGQQAEGGLQTPSVDPLQPNARIKNYENAEIN